MPTPINVGTNPQAKAGRISATEFYDYNNPAYYLNPSGNSNLGELQVGSTFKIDSQGIPSWGGKTFTGYAEVEVRTGTGSECKEAVEGQTCQQRCESYGQTCVNMWYQCQTTVCSGYLCFGPNACSHNAIEGDRCECSSAIYGKIIVPTFK